VLLGNLSLKIVEECRVVILDIWRQSNILNGQDGWTDMSLCPLSIEHIRHIL
jgi:hypothetical protein